MKQLFLASCFLVFFGFFGQSAFAFSDVKKEDYYYEAVEWAQQQAIISGFEDNTFRPSEKVTHRQFIKMYTNAFDFNKANMQGEDYYAVLEDYGFNFVSSKNRSITRGEVAVLITYANGAVHKPNAFDNYIDDQIIETSAQFLLDKGISGGQQKGNTASKRLGALNELTRAQAITFLYRLEQKQLNTVAESVKRYKEPAKFTEQAAVIRSYDFGEDIHYHVLGEGNAFRLAVTYKDYVIGGYETEDGKDVYGSVVGGKQNQQNLGYVTVIPYKDGFKGNRVRAISWWAGAPAFQDIVQKARTLTYSAETTNISKLYGELANEFRVKYGENPLEEHWVLSTAALTHSQDMSKRNYFDHDTPEGLSPSDRVKGNTEIDSVGENISAGYSDIFAAHAGWINSGGHRANLLSDYDFIGFGLAMVPGSSYGMYYTTKFASDWSRGDWEEY